MAQHRSDDERIDDTLQRDFNRFYAQQDRNTRHEGFKAAMLVFVPVVALGVGAVVALTILFS